MGGSCGGPACEESLPDRSGVEGDAANCSRGGLDSLEWNRARNLEGILAAKLMNSQGDQHQACMHQATEDHLHEPRLQPHYFQGNSHRVAY